jgi:hypothetical protein
LQEAKNEELQRQGELERAKGKALEPKTYRPGDLVISPDGTERTIPTPGQPFSRSTPYGTARYDANGKMIAGPSVLEKGFVTAKALLGGSRGSDDYSLSPGQSRFRGSNKIAEVPPEPKEEKHPTFEAYFKAMDSSKPWISGAQYRGALGRVKKRWDEEYINEWVDVKDDERIDWLQLSRDEQRALAKAEYDSQYGTAAPAAQAPAVPFQWSNIQAGQPNSASAPIGPQMLPGRPATAAQPSLGTTASSISEQTAARKATDAEIDNVIGELMRQTGRKPTADEIRASLAKKGLSE